MSECGTVWVMRTEEEIAQHIAATRAEDVLGFYGEALLEFLSFDKARPFLKTEATVENWGATPPLTRDAVIARMREYMAFAWEKVRNHRGISANRSVDKMRGWVWLLGDDPITASYPQYGAPILYSICDLYGFPVPDGEDIANMSEGLPCRPDCDEGCGR